MVGIRGHEVEGGVFAVHGGDGVEAGGNVLTDDPPAGRDLDAGPVPAGKDLLVQLVPDVQEVLIRDVRGLDGNAEGDRDGRGIGLRERIHNPGGGQGDFDAGRNRAGFRRRGRGDHGEGRSRLRELCFHDRFDGGFGFLPGKAAVEEHALHEILRGIGEGFKHALRKADGLFLPVGTAGVHGGDDGVLRVSVKEELVDQPLAGKGEHIQVDPHAGIDFNRRRFSQAEGRDEQEHAEEDTENPFHLMVPPFSGIPGFPAGQR